MVAGGRLVSHEGLKAPAWQRHDGAARVPAPGRAARLRIQLQGRFGPALAALDEWAEAHAQAHGYAPPLRAATLDEIDQGITPSLPRIEALAAAAGWPFEDLARELGVDFSELPRLRAALGSGFTRLDPVSLVLPTRDISVPADFTSWADPFLPEQLAPQVARWESDTVLTLTASMRPGRTTVLLDEPHGPGYPRVPLRALLHVETGETMPVGDRFYLVEHPFGWSCCRLQVDGPAIVLASEDRRFHPSLRLSRTNVRIHGRVVAFAARLDRLATPKPMPLGELERGPRRWHGPEWWQRASPTEMLRYVIERHGLSYRAIRDQAARLHEIAEHGGPGHRRARGAALSAGALQNHLHPNPERPVMPVLETVFTFAAVFGIEPRDLLRAYGVPLPAAPPAPDPGRLAASAARLDRLRSQPFGAHLEREGWDLAWLWSLLRWGGADRVYHLGTSNFEMAPLLLPNAFVTVDPLQRPARAGSPPARSEAIEWERPLYLLRRKGRNGFVCAYCEEADDGSLCIVPHPRSVRQSTERLPRQEAAVLGRVTAVATLLG